MTNLAGKVLMWREPHESCFMCLYMHICLLQIREMKPGANVVCRNSELRSQLVPKVYVDKRQGKDKCLRMTFVLLEAVI